MPGMPGMPGMLVFFGCILALPVAGDSPLDWDIRFHCVTQDVSDMDFCRGPQNGNCPNTSKCFMRKDFSTQHVWGGCCCDRNSTPVEMIENDHHDWSCWVHFVTDVRETKGKDPYCDVLCCPRPFQALACHGQLPQCCDGQVSECGISLSGDPCCAPRQGSGGCCVNLGRTCGFLRFGLYGDSPCCLENEPKTCYPACTIWPFIGSVLLLLAAIAFQWCSFRAGKRRKCQMWVTFAIASYSGILLLAILQPGSPRWEACVWTLANCLVGFVVARAASGRKLWLRPPWQKRRDAVPLQEGKRIVVTIHIKEYMFLTAVPDYYMKRLRQILRADGWEVLTSWDDLVKGDIQGCLKMLQNALRHTLNAEVLIYISCHSQMIWGVPCIVLVDEAQMPRGWSLFELARELRNMENTKKAHFAIIWNGCLAEGGWRMWLSEQRWWMGDRLQCLPRLLGTKNEADFWVMFSCQPGRYAEQHFCTKHVVEILERGGALTFNELLQQFYRACSPPEDPQAENAVRGRNQLRQKPWFSSDSSGEHYILQSASHCSTDCAENSTAAGSRRQSKDSIESIPLVDSQP
ncbi:unnamed protein product [Effrenium voratum]|nr:unnamed protein product [Effrenium voratum]